jgi:hypothetical protein
MEETIKTMTEKELELLRSQMAEEELELQAALDEADDYASRE